MHTPNPLNALITYLDNRDALRDEINPERVTALGDALSVLGEVTPDAARAQQTQGTRLADALFCLREDLRGLRGHERTLNGDALSDWLRNWEGTITALLDTPARATAALPCGVRVTFIRKGNTCTGSIMNTVWDAMDAAFVTAYLIALPGDEHEPDAWLTIQARHVTGLAARTVSGAPETRGTPVQ